MKQFEIEDGSWARGVVLWVMLGAWSMPAEGVAAPISGGEPPATAAASTSSVSGLAVKVEPTVPDGEKLRGWVEDQGRTALAERPPLEPGDFVRIVVAGGPWDYRVKIELVRRERVLGEQPGELVCECNSDELLKKVGDAIGEGVDRLAEIERREREAAAQNAQNAQEEREERERAELADGESGPRMGPLGYAGIGGGVVGAGMLGAGIGLAVRPNEIRGEPGSLEIRSMRGAGIGLAATGGVVLAAGVALIVVDVVRRRGRSTALVPTLAPQYAGLVVARRF
jgi:hypothetical protein